MLRSVARHLFKAVFSSGDLKYLHNALKIARTQLSIDEDFYNPYMVAIDYLASGRDPAVIERRNPEMRDAVQLLVELFDKGQIRTGK